MTVEIYDKTIRYKKFNIPNYIESAIKYVPESDLEGIQSITIYDQIPDCFPLIISGGFWQPEGDRGCLIALYIREALHFMLAFENSINIFNSMWEHLFINAFGKLFIHSVLFHEIGHNVYNTTVNNGVYDRVEADKYSNEYEIKLYSSMHPLLSANYEIFNNLYHKLYKNRIAKAKEIEIGGNSCGLTTG